MKTSILLGADSCLMEGVQTLSEPTRTTESDWSSLVADDFVKANSAY